jgi:hypothetical protein
MTKRNRVAVLLLFISLAIAQAHSQTKEPNEKFSQSAQAASEVRTSRIRKELRTLKNHEWAGEYYYGDGLGVNVSLALAPESGFVFTWHGCLGLYDLNYGKIDFENGTVKLAFTYPNKPEGFQGIAPELLPVHWGKRHYLIPVDRILDFTNAINAGTEPSPLFGGRSGNFLLNRGDEKKSVAGPPPLPSEFLSYILHEPIKANISSVEHTDVEASRRTTVVRIDAGSSLGLKSGMEFFVHNPSRLYANAVVTDVSEYSAMAVIEQDDVTDPTPSVGWQLSTKL